MLAQFVGGTVAGMVFGDALFAATPVPTTVVSATSAAASPSGARATTTAEASAMGEAKQTLWLAATCVIIAIAVLGFGSKHLNNMRLA